MRRTALQQGLAPLVLVAALAGCGKYGPPVRAKRPAPAVPEQAAPPPAPTPQPAVPEPAPESPDTTQPSQQQQRPQQQPQQEPQP